VFVDELLELYYYIVVLLGIVLDVLLGVLSDSQIFL
jgi:hypothetical protein